MNNSRVQTMISDFLGGNLSASLIFLDRSWAAGEIKDLAGGFAGEKNFAVAGPGRVEAVLLSETELRILDRKSPGFINRLKLMTEGKGFEKILVIDPDPEALRRALGAAGVFGEVILAVGPSGPVTCDLQDTINYKSLRVITRKAPVSAAKSS